jgi:hypothetical protein
MEILRELARLYLKHQLGLIPNSEIVSWAIDNYHIDSFTPENNSLLKIASLLTNTVDTEQASTVARATLSEFGFDYEGQREQFAQEFFIEYSHHVLSGSISLYQYCRLILALDAEFNVPVWLGSLFNHCDWREQNEPLDQATKKEIIETLKKLETTFQIK